MMSVKGNSTPFHYEERNAIFFSPFLCHLRQCNEKCFENSSGNNNISLFDTERENYYGM